MIDLPKNIVSVDSETTGTNMYSDFKHLGFYPARPFFWAFTNLRGESFHVRWEVDPFTRQVIPEKKTFRIVKQIMTDKRIIKVGHNIGFDILMSILSGTGFEGDFEDTLTIAHVATGGSEMTYALKPFCKKTMGFEDNDEKDLQKSAVKGRALGRKKGWYIAEGKIFGSDPVKADYWLADKKLCAKYGTEDTVRAMLIYRGLREKVKSNPGMESTYQMEKSLFPITWRAERLGTKVSISKLQELEKFYTQYQMKYRRIANLNGGKGMNFNSPKQLQAYFYDKKKYEVIKKTKTGAPSADGETMVYFINRYNDKLAKAILEYNGAGQMLNGFVQPYLRYKALENGVWVLHPNYKQVGPVTGRFACKDPNLMNVAADDSGRKKANVQLRPRESLGPRKGCIWYMPDYSQIEVWVLSFLSQEPDLMEILLSGTDFHEGISRRVWGSEPDYDENKTMYRKRAKNVNFCKFYGGGVGKVAQLIGCSYAESSRFVHEYDTRNPAIKRFMNRISNMMIQDKKIVNPFGRHYFLPPTFAYKATNYMVQGTAADIFKRACINIKTRIPNVEQLLFMHDEWAIEIPLKLHTEAMMRKVVSCLQGDFHKKIGCPIPLPVGMKTTKTTWAEAKEIKWVKEEWENEFICKKN